MSNESDIKKRHTKALNTPSPLGTDAVRDISGELNALPADIFGVSTWRVRPIADNAKTYEKAYTYSEIPTDG